VSEDLRKIAVEMLLNGATLAGEPCPYCMGVRVIKDGNAFCVNCGRQGIGEKPQSTQEAGNNPDSPLDKLEQKLKELTDELSSEKDYEKQQQILRSISDIISVKEKLKKL